MNQEEKLTNNNLKESIIQETENPINSENDKKELLESISPIINDTLLNKDESNINHLNINSPSIKNEEYFDYKAKKIKLFNLYNQLLEFRQKLILKEKELNTKEKNLLEFEKILKANETILKNNIEQFDIYIKNKINEIKQQFNQIEQIQINKENYLKQKEEEIINFKNQSYNLNINYDKNINNSNNNKCINCNCDLCNEDEIIKPFIDNYLSEIESNGNNINHNENVHYKKINYNGKNGFFCNGCNNYFRSVHHQKNKSIDYIRGGDSKFNHFKNNFMEYNNKDLNKRYIHKTFENSNDSNRYNYTCSCPGCDFCSL